MVTIIEADLTVCLLARSSMRKWFGPVGCFWWSMIQCRGTCMHIAMTALVSLVIKGTETRYVVAELLVS